MRVRLGLLLTLALAAFPATASAAPDKTGTLNADSTSFKWEGSGTAAPLHGYPIDEAVAETPLPHPSPCDSEAHDCDYVLLNVEHKGDLTVTGRAGGSQTVTVPSQVPVFGELGNVLTAPDIDLSIYRSNAAGEVAEDEEDLAEGKGGGANAEETMTLPGLAPGFYLVQVSFFIGNDSPYSAEAKLANAVAPVKPVVVTETPAPPAPAEPAPPAQPAAPAQPAQPAQPSQPAQPAKKPVSRKAACKAAARKVKNGKKRSAALKRCAKLKK
jgi:hypothetical protein